MADPEQVQLRTVWPTVSDERVDAVNTFISQIGPPAGPSGIPDGIYLTAGFVSPPILLGEPQDIKAQIEALGGALPVRVVARFALSRERAEELKGILETSIAQFDEQAGTRIGHV